MARRKRLTLPGSDLPGAGHADPGHVGLPPLETKAMSFTAPPIARVAAEASATAALGDLAAAWHEARDSGRLIQALPLAMIDEGWLVRDRIALDTEEMADLVASIRERGQQVPIEVVAQDGGRYGLISGWRRLRALKVLADERGPSDPATVLAILRRPSGAAEAYRAMVEENEIRAGLSYYERARVAARAAEAGVFTDPRAAISALFAAASRAKRSKIGSFLTLVDGLDDQLRFAWAIPERLGLTLARALESESGFRDRLRDRLRKAKPETLEAEIDLLTRSLDPRAQMPKDALEKQETGTAGDRQSSAHLTPRGEEIRPGIWLETSTGTVTTRLMLTGDRVDDTLRARLVAWLQASD